ncbi:MAG: AAA family ATPase [Acidobacteriaceae bacterium]|nr:AAA family ATPase [Acidobacteriaceae bacterium]
MIQKIILSGCVPYNGAPTPMEGLRAVNYIYGANGVGKTTLSRLVTDASHFPQCSVTWANGHPLHPLVYNRDFVRDYFSENTKLKGIFTLGNEGVNVQSQIEAAKAQCEELTKQIHQREATLNGPQGTAGKQGEMDSLEESFREECWKLKVKHGVKLKDALRGFLESKKSFRDQLVRECGKTPSRPVLTQAVLEEKAATLYGQTPLPATEVPAFDEAAFLQWEIAPVLTRRILGKADVDIAGLILKLGNSDWVKEGVPFLNAAEGRCPFCQQTAPPTLAASLEEYFDETFLQDTSALKSTEAGYKLEGERLLQSFRQMAQTDARFLSTEKLATEVALFEARYTLNLQRIASKVKEPSQIATLEPVKEIIDAIHTLAADANSRIKAHNEMVANLQKERTQLGQDVWAFLAQVEIASAYKTYTSKKEGLQKAVDSLKGQITQAEQQRAEYEKNIRQLEKSITSIQPTVDAINTLLKGFGFRSFHLECVAGNFYRLCRHDGADAQHTLSEGERSFVTFLYFYHLLNGSMSEAGLTTDRIVVFDDPVSSLDNDVLFIVSSLIRQVIERVRKQDGRIKQVFVLTHNVYFFKEVVFDSSRDKNGKQSHETFWTIRKVNDVSSLQSHAFNPIKNSYDLLWEPLRTPNLVDQALQNNMRRILEHYFRILGGVSDEKILGQFDGEEKLICRSLLSWVNDGSHSVPDDIFHTLDESAMQKYIEVFRNIFIKMDHANHFNMMMGQPYIIVSEA